MTTFSSERDLEQTLCCRNCLDERQHRIGKRDVNFHGGAGRHRHRSRVRQLEGALCCSSFANRYRCRDLLGAAGVSNPDQAEHWRWRTHDRKDLQGIVLERSIGGVSDCHDDRHSKRRIGSDREANPQCADAGADRTRMGAVEFSGAARTGPSLVPCRISDKTVRNNDLVRQPSWRSPAHIICDDNCGLRATNKL
ncbi:unannotated protein [freshwater metagenome]|uniref:Unannotated protein n=1 Tax=freshwater metagenome TaxID=449393 RepID=A0A6J7K601_9ZZZZ